MRARLADFALIAYTRERRGSSSSDAMRPESDEARGHRRKPETFNFLGFTHISRSTAGGESSSLNGSLAATGCAHGCRQSRRSYVDGCMRRSMSRGVAATGVVMGFNAYHAVPTNAVTLSDFLDTTSPIYGGGHYVAAAREEGGDVGRMTVLTNRWLPRPRITHPLA